MSAIVIRFVPRSVFEGEGTGKTILIVERWFNLNIRHIYWKLYLEKRGFRVYIVNFSIWKGAFENSAVRLKKYMEKRDLNDVTLVGISSGAITSLLYLEEKEGWKRVSRFIAVGAPFHGTWIAIIISFLKSGRELLPKSRLIQKISALKLSNPNKIICIRAKFDEMVPTGAVLPNTKGITIKAFGHNNLHIRISGTYKKIIEIANNF